MYLILTLCFYLQKQGVRISTTGFLKPFHDARSSNFYKRFSQTFARCQEFKFLQEVLSNLFTDIPKLKLGHNKIFNQEKK
ncbi:hypothetical protein L2E82_04441 [Cichorium intybus]|uniref:Uncharacterized protein n=1 Tax=Cichorium intybus TaxID=13427 RepID=A0ACB9H5J6_CICIN|nr:hypothetical protein L2E82_04441 [Cichorium intybus]